MGGDAYQDAEITHRTTAAPMGATVSLTPELCEQTAFSRFNLNTLGVGEYEGSGVEHWSWRARCSRVGSSPPGVASHMPNSHEAVGHRATAVKPLADDHADRDVPRREQSDRREHLRLN